MPLLLYAGCSEKEELLPVSRWCGAGRPGKKNIKSPCCAVHCDSFIFGGIRKWRTNSFSPCHDLCPTCCFPFFLFLADDNFGCFGWYKIYTLLWSGQEENGKYRASTHLDGADPTSSESSSTSV